MENAKKIHLLLHMHRSEFSFFFTNEDAPANLVSYLCFKFGEVGRKLWMLCG